MLVQLVVTANSLSLERLTFTTIGLQLLEPRTSLAAWHGKRLACTVTTWPIYLTSCAKPKDKEDKQNFFIDMEDPVIRGMTCVHDNAITWPPPESVTKTSAQAKKEVEKIDLDNLSEEDAEAVAMLEAELRKKGEL